MKILQINATYGIGSTGRYTKLLHENLKKRGHESYVVATITDGSEKIDENIFIPCNTLSKKINAFKARVTGNQNNIAAKSTKSIIGFIDKVCPDVIQLENIHANFVNLTALLDYVARKDIHLVVVLHDCWFFTGKCTNYIDAGCLGWQKKCGNCPKLKKDIPAWFFDKTEMMLEQKRVLFDSIKKLTVVGVSEKITEDAKKSYVFGGRNCMCIPNAVNDKIFFARESRNEHGRVKVIAGAAFEWSEHKGINKFAELSGICKKEFGDAVKVKLAGDCVKLTKQVIENLKTAGVEMAGLLPQEKLAEFYRDSDVFVSLSKGESFGCSIAEAMACGLPVVAYEGYAEKSALIKNNRCEIVKNTENIEEILKKIKNFLYEDSDDDTKSSVDIKYKPLCVEEYVERFLTMYEHNC